MSTWVGSICDEETARKACGSAIMADNQLGMVDGDLSTVTTAKAAAVVANEAATRSICDRPIGQDCARGFQVAYNFSGTFGSTFAALEASLPDSTGHVRQMIHS